MMLVTVILVMSLLSITVFANNDNATIQLIGGLGSDDAMPLLIAIGDNSPTSDVLLAVDVISELKEAGYDFPVELSKVFSDINAKKLDNQVTLVIYNGEAIIIVGQTSPTDHVLFALEISTILKKNEVISSKTILSSDIISSDLYDLFKENELVQNCYDSDNGINYSKKGIVISKENKQWDDACSHNKGSAAIVSTCTDCYVSEYSCSSFPGALTTYDGVYYKYEKCDSTCSNGACVSEIKSCQDTDGGVNTFKKGSIVAQENSLSGTDTCAVALSGSPSSNSASYKPVSSCSGSNCYVDEYFTMYVNEDIQCRGISEVIACKYGCNNGACIVEVDNDTKYALTNETQYKQEITENSLHMYWSLATPIGITDYRISDNLADSVMVKNNDDAAMTLKKVAINNKNYLTSSASLQPGDQLMLSFDEKGSICQYAGQSYSVPVSIEYEKSGVVRTFNGQQKLIGVCVDSEDSEVGYGQVINSKVLSIPVNSQKTYSFENRDYVVKFHGYNTVTKEVLLDVNGKKYGLLQGETEIVSGLSTTLNKANLVQSNQANIELEVQEKCNSFSCDSTKNNVWYLDWHAKNSPFYANNKQYNIELSAANDAGYFLIDVNGEGTYGDAIKEGQTLNYDEISITLNDGLYMDYPTYGGTAIVSIKGVSGSDSNETSIKTECPNVPVPNCLGEMITNYADNGCVESYACRRSPEKPVDGDCIDGCETEKSCLPVGTRLVENGQAMYCSYEGSLAPQLELDSSCQNDYECMTNTCQSGRCMDLAQEIRETKSLMQSIFDWLSSIFRR